MWRFQTGVKNIFHDTQGKPLPFRLSSANSINIGRLAPQIMYYFRAYRDLLDRKAITLGDKVDFSVPTGNFGDILAGYLAKKLGLPLGRLYCASNANNVLTPMASKSPRADRSSAARSKRPGSFARVGASRRGPAAPSSNRQAFILVPPISNAPIRMIYFSRAATKRLVMSMGRVMAEPTTAVIAPRSMALRSSSGVVRLPSATTGFPDCSTRVEIMS